MPVSTDATIINFKFIDTQRLNFTDGVASVVAIPDKRPNNNQQVIVAIFSGSDNLNNISKYFIATASVSTYANYQSITINGHGVSVALNTERGNKNASVRVTGDSSQYEGAFISVYSVYQPSIFFRENVVFSKRIRFKEYDNSFLIGTSYDFSPSFLTDRAKDNSPNWRYKYQIDDNPAVIVTYSNPSAYEYKIGASKINTVNTFDVFDVTLLVPKSVGAGEHTFSLWMEPDPLYPDDLEYVADLSDREELVTAFSDMYTDAPLAPAVRDRNETYEAIFSDAAITTQGLVDKCRAYLAVNDSIREGYYDQSTETFNFEKSVYGDSNYKFIVDISDGVRYRETFYSSANNPTLKEGVRLGLFYVVTGEDKRPYKDIIPEQEIAFDNDDYGWPLNERYDAALQDAIDTEVHCELTLLDTGEVFDTFAYVDLTNRGEAIQILITKGYYFYLDLFGYQNSVYSNVASDQYTGPIKFHVYVRTEPEPEPEKDDPMMSSKWNKNFTAQYNDNSTAGEIKDFLRKEKKKITGHNIHELLDDFEEGGDGGDDSGSSCKCISLVEEINQNVHTLKGATAKEVLDAVYAGIPVGIALNSQTFGGQGMGPGFLGHIYLDSSNNTYYANVYGGLGINVSNPQNATAYGFGNMLIFSGTANAELSFTDGGSSN